MTSNGTTLAQTANARAGDTRQVARLALREGFTPEAAVAELPEGAAPLVAQAISDYEAALVPLNRTEPQGGEASRTVADAFAPIGAKMRPDMSEDQAQIWASSIVLAFSDLPSGVVVAALKEAVHIPFAWPTDMEAKVRELAQAKLQRQRTALLRLRLMQEELARAASTISTPQLESEPYQATVDEVRGMTATLRRIGVACGAISAEDLATVEAEEREAIDEMGKSTT